MSLAVSVGHASLTGPRPQNEDFCGVVTPEGNELEVKGVLAAVADGVGGAAHGREAAEHTVRGLLADYYATSETWSVAKALDVVVMALNRWLVSQAAARRELAGMATTLTAVVLRGNRWYSAHAGDSRLYLWRDGQLARLTEDHVWEHPEMRHVLRRAVGLDAHLMLDHADGELKAGDVFLLASDGIWSTLGEAQLAERLARPGDLQETAEALAAAAVERGAQDNCTALLLRADGVPAASLRDRLAQGRRQPVPPRLKPGQTLDGLQVEEVLHESRATLLYRVKNAAGQALVLKTLLPEADDEEAKNALLHEEWLARRLTAHYFPQVVAHPARSHLYYLMSWHEGETLKAMLARGHRFSVAEGAQIGLRLLKGIAALHRLGIAHRDIKPDNLHLGQDGRLRILDLGVAAADGIEHAEAANPGTPSYMAPELFAGTAASAQSDLYAAGVTLYELLTRKYPYGEIEPFQRPKFGEPVTPLRYRPDLPQWLEAVILKAVAREPKARFETAEEFLLALERGAHKPLALPRRTPLLQRDPQLALKLIAAASIALNLLLVWLLLAR